MEKFLRNELVKELKNVSTKMLEEQDLAKRLFYYSAAFGVIDRTMRYAFDRDLLLTFTVLNVSYNSFMERVRSLSTGDRTVPLTKEQLDDVAKQVDALSNAFKNGEDVCDILKEITLLSYMSTGPGHYLQLNKAF